MNTRRAIRRAARFDLVSATLVAVCLHCGCGDGDGREGIDAAKANAGPWIPPESETYEVLGYHHGLDGVVVRYDERLFRGGAIKTEAGIQILATLGIRTIVNLAPSGPERDLAEKYGILLLELPFGPGDPLDAGKIAAFVEQFERGRAPFYVHGREGRQRAGVIGYAYRVCVQHWPEDKARGEFVNLGGDASAAAAQFEAVNAWCRGSEHDSTP